MQSFQNIPDWIEDVKSERGNDVIIFLIGNKIDLEEDRKVKFEEAQAKAEELGVHFTEVSAKSGINIPEFFQQLSIMLSGGGENNDGPQQQQGQEQKQPEAAAVKLSNNPEEGKDKKKSGGCC